MNSENIKKFMDESSSYVSNLNRALKNIKSKIIVKFIWSDSMGITIVTNKVTLASDLQTIENYVKTANHINSTRVEVLCLSQSKSYLKIIGIPYYQENSSSSITVIYKSTCPENYIPAVMPPLNPTSLPSTAATFLATHLMAVLQPSGYSVFHGGDTPIQLGLPWRSCSCQCLNTETSARGNRGFTTETPSISYSISLYIRLVVTL